MLRHLQLAKIFVRYLRGETFAHLGLVENVFSLKMMMLCVLLREEWELSSPKSYYLVDHAMTAHMTGPEFHRHYTELHRRGGGAVTQPDNT